MPFMEEQFEIIATDPPNTRTIIATDCCTLIDAHSCTKNKRLIKVEPRSYRGCP